MDVKYIRIQNIVWVPIKQWPFRVNTTNFMHFKAALRFASSSHSPVVHRVIISLIMATYNVCYAANCRAERLDSIIIESEKEVLGAISRKWRESEKSISLCLNPSRTCTHTHIHVIFLGLIHNFESF